MIRKNTRSRVLWTCFVALPLICGMFIPQRAVGFSDYVQEPDLIDEGLKSKSVSWEIVRAFGLFAEYDLHAGSRIQWTVYNASETGLYYEAKQKTLSWFSDDWSNSSLAFRTTPSGTQYLLGYNNTANRTFYQNEFIYDGANATNIMPFWGLIAPKAWSQIGRMVVNGYEAYDIWGSYAERLENTTIWIENKWFPVDYNWFWDVHLPMWYLIDVVHIKVALDAQNYDHLVYTRQEGILLSRQIRIRDGGITGDFEIQIRTLDVTPELSPWYYIIIFSIIFGSILAVAVIISLLISRRKTRLRQLDY